MYRRDGANKGGSASVWLYLVYLEAQVWTFQLPLRELGNKPSEVKT